MGGEETQEFVELLNASPAVVNLDGWRLELVNGSNDEPYLTVNLNGELAPGAYAVVGDPTVDVPDGVRLFELPGAGHDIQNGPDGVRLMNADGRVDGMSYGRPIEGTGEGDRAPNDVNDDAGQSVSRCPDGADTDDNSADFQLAPASPGAANTCN